MRPERSFCHRASGHRVEPCRNLYLRRPHSYEQEWAESRCESFLLNHNLEPEYANRMTVRARCLAQTALTEFEYSRRTLRNSVCRVGPCISPDTRGKAQQIR